MFVLQHHSRRLLQATASASPPNNDDNNFDINAHFSPSMAIILVVLLSAFFFMGFFSIYVRRCTTREDDEATRARAARAPTHPPSNSQSQGVDPAFLETLPLVSYSSSKKKGSNVECVVCLTDFDEGEPLRQLPRCKHVFHKECIDMWLFSHTTCPLCRRNVQSDGSLSFRWGGSGSLRLSLGRIRSRRESGRGSTAGPSTPAESLSHRDTSANANANEDVDGIVLPSVRSLPRSHSTGHSLVKQGQSSMMITRVGTPDYSDAEQDTEPKAGCLPVTPTGGFRRSRSMIAVRDEAVTTPVSIGAWMRGARASLRRALSFKKVSPAAGDLGTPVGPAAAAASSSARSTFDRL